MAKETLSLGGATGALQFRNGTVLEPPPMASGAATHLTPDSRGLRSATMPADIDTSADFERAMAQLDVYEQETIHLDLDAPAPGLRGPAAPERIVLRPAVPAGDDAPRVVLYQDESGGLSWHFATPMAVTQEERERAARRGFRISAAGRDFVIPLRGKPAREALVHGTPRGSHRGPITKIGRKIFKVLVLPVASRLLESPVQWIVAPVERRIRQNRIWKLSPENYRSGPAEEFSDWSLLDGKRTLLVVHGILSSVEGMLGGLPESVMRDWCDRYEGRVLAFNHLSVSLSPEDNARFFLESVRNALPQGRLRFDVLCHSRGGIVSRTMVERGRVLVSDTVCDFDSVYFVASPNRGSILGNADHTVDLIDLFTNLLTSLPDGPTAYSIEVLLAMVKLVAHSAESSLPGVSAMATKGYISDVLNTATEKSPARYGAAAAEYQPSAGKDNGWLLGTLSDHAVTRLFEEAGRPVANDLVVPRDGVFGANGHPSFPIGGPLLFRPPDGVSHTSFFSRAETIAHINTHLGFAETTLLPDRDRQVAGTPTSPSRGRRLRGGGAVASAPELPAVTLERKSWIEYHELVEVGQVTDLVVRLDELTKDEANAERLRIALKEAENETTLTVELSAPGFRVVGARHQPIGVKRQRDARTEQATFTLDPLPAGPEPVRREIIAAFWHDNSCIGTTTHTTTVVPKGYQGALNLDTQDRTDPIRVPETRREWADVVVVVRQLDKDNSYDLSIRCQLPEDPYELKPMDTLTINQGLTKYLSDFLDPPFRRFPDPTLPDAQYDPALAKWNAAFITTLKDLGKQLWTLLPVKFRDEYIRLMSLPRPPRSICIHSDEMLFPWEIVVPSDIGGGQYREWPALGISHVMGRWRPGLSARPRPQTIQVDHLAVINPRYTNDALAWSEQEKQQLLDLFPAADPCQPATRAELDVLLARNDIQFVHFSGHGDWSGDINADLSSLRLEAGDTLTASAFAATRLGAEAQPLLFLNACTIGRSGLVIGRPGGFAANCLQAGWSGVVSSYWPVYDPKAFEFSIGFYKKLKLGRSIGEALQELRAENASDPTALSYSYFGDPWARARLA